jgi:large subunit ribosomal protein L29
MAVGVTASELRTSTEEELVTKLREAKEELFNLRFQAATGQLESHGRLRGVRREIARIYTVMRERELGIVTVEEAVEEAPAADEASKATPRRRPRRAAREAVADEAGADEARADDAGTEQAGTDEAGAEQPAGAAEAEEPDGNE